MRDMQVKKYLNVFRLGKHFLSSFYTLSIDHKYTEFFLILDLCFTSLELQRITLASDYYRSG